jgi:predicted transcriptional regulator of viral defense system
MRRTDFLRVMDEWDRRGRRVFTLTDLRRLFPDDARFAFRNGIARIAAEEDPLLQRAAKGVFVYMGSHQSWANIQEEVARALRRGHHTYVSLESALSEHGRISQIPLSRLTLMTTGRTGTFETPWGVIEFSHTRRSVAEFMPSVSDVGRPLPLASAELALDDLRRVGRNLHMVLTEPEEEPDAAFF